PGRLERFCPGTPASVAVICGPAGQFTLAPCRQRLSADGRFSYLGGECPLPAELHRRATVLAGQALATLPEPTGYLGVDIVLGNQPDGSSDVVVEINPRLTTSYVGLRAVSATNLAGAMLDAAEGKVPCLSWRKGRVEFDADGTVRELAG